MTSSTSNSFQLNQSLELHITDFSSSGDGIGHVDQNPFMFFVPNVVPGDRIQAKITQLKRKFARAELIKVLEPSPQRVRPPCIVADKCGGCQWMAADYPLQLQSKQNQVKQALMRIGKFSNPNVLDILAAEHPLGYRNKATYPLGLSGDHQKVKAGYYQKGTHKLINLNQCPVQDPQLNPLLAEIKQDIQAQGWPIYDESKHEGVVRYLGFRTGRRTQDILMTLVATSSELPHLEEQAHEWLERYPNLVGVTINLNPDRTNRILGPKTQTLAGRSHLFEVFAGLKFAIQPHTFFQIFTEQAEKILETILETLQLTGAETIVDAYCGVGSMTLPLAQHAESVLGIEVQADSIRQAKQNARMNQIHNVRFKTGKVEQVLAEMTLTPDILLLDPPRKGCEGAVLESIQRLQPQRVLYLSCNPATLARDLLILSGKYNLDWVQPVDFFPQTAHVESLASLTVI